MAVSENELHIREVLNRVGRKDLAEDDTKLEYNRWAETYEKDTVGKLGYAAHVHVANKLCELFHVDKRSHVRLLDAGAGTGLLGRQLKEKRFTQMDALDPSEDMLVVAREKNVYTNFYCEYLTESPLRIVDGTYDAVVGIGMLGHHHAPFAAMHEMARLAKPGGYVILCVRRQLLYSYPEYVHMEPIMEQLECSGKWKKVEKAVFPNYFNSSEGLLYVFNVL